jgi:hypothetical protein
MNLEFLVFNLLIIKINKKSLGIRVSTNDFKYHFNSDYNSFNLGIYYDIDELYIDNSLGEPNLKSLK